MSPSSLQRLPSASPTLYRGMLRLRGPPETRWRCQPSAETVRLGRTSRLSADLDRPRPERCWTAGSHPSAGAIATGPARGAHGHRRFPPPRWCPKRCPAASSVVAAAVAAAMKAGTAALAVAAAMKAGTAALAAAGHGSQRPGAVAGPATRDRGTCRSREWQRADWVFWTSWCCRHLCSLTAWTLASAARSQAPTLGWMCRMRGQGSAMPSAAQHRRSDGDGGRCWFLHCPTRTRLRARHLHCPSTGYADTTPKRGLAQVSGPRSDPCVACSGSAATSDGPTLLNSSWIFCCRACVPGVTYSNPTTPTFNCAHELHALGTGTAGASWPTLSASSGSTSSSSDPDPLSLRWIICACPDATGWAWMRVLRVWR